MSEFNEHRNKAILHFKSFYLFQEIPVTVFHFSYTKDNSEAH